MKVYTRWSLLLQVAASDGKETEGAATAAADAGDPEADQEERDDLPKPEEVIKSFIAAKVGFLQG